MKKYIIRIALALAGYISASSAWAETIGWHPILQGIRTGRGVDLRNQKDLKGFVAVMGTNNVGISGGGGFEQKTRYVQDTYDLAQSFSLNTSLSIQSKVFSGSVGYASAEAHTASGNSISFAMDCTRVLGDDLFPVLTLDPDFTNTVAQLRQTLSGSSLHKAISDRYGTHFVSGMQRAFKAVMLYTFTFQSQSSARAQSLSLSAKYRGGVSRATFSADVSSFLGQRDSKVTMTYSFMSTDPLAPPPPFATNSVISNLTQFTTIADQFENYCRTANLAGATPISYTVEPLQNLPGYLAMLGGYSPATVFLPNYADYMQTFSEFGAWADLLNYWTGDPRRMNWLNTNGQRMVFSMRSEVSGFLSVMRDTARSHFTNGTSLEISADILNYRANLAQIPMPRVVVIGRYIQPDVGLYVGYVNAGARDLTVSNPFQSVFMTYNGNEFGKEVQLWTDERQFRDWINSHPGEPYLPLFNSPDVFGGPRWAAVVAATNTQRIAFFFGGDYRTDWNPAAWVIKDAATPSQVVDSVAVLEARTDQLEAASLQAGPSGVRLINKGTASLSPAGRTQTLEFVVTNAGPNSVYGTEVAVPVPDGLDVLSVQTSQGFATQSGRDVRFNVGALAVGSTATLYLRVVPLRVGTVGGTGVLSLSLAPELPALETGNSTLPLPVLQTTAPLLSLEREGGLLKLRWQADTDRLMVEEASSLAPGSLWLGSSNTVETIGSNRSIERNPNSPTRFFRLKLH